MEKENNAPGEQGTPPQQQGDQAPEGYVETKRFTGVVQKVETLTKTLEKAQGSLAEKSSQISDLESQLAELQDTHKTTLSEKEAAISSLQEQIDEKTKKLTELEALQLKVKVANEMGRSDLLPILEHIPNSTDKDAVKASLQAFAKLADDAAKKREEQLRTGLVETPEGDLGTNPGKPASREAWIEHIQSLPIGSPERAKAMDDYGAFMRAQENFS